MNASAVVKHALPVYWHQQLPAITGCTDNLKSTLPEVEEVEDDKLPPLHAFHCKHKRVAHCLLSSVGVMPNSVLKQVEKYLCVEKPQA